MYLSKEEFRGLNRMEQDALITKYGVYVLNYLQGDFMCDLYKLNGFFVKLCYKLTDDKDPEIAVCDYDDGVKLYNSGSPLFDKDLSAHQPL